MDKNGSNEIIFVNMYIQGNQFTLNYIQTIN